MLGAVRVEPKLTAIDEGDVPYVITLSQNVGRFFTSL
jgi:hypothetical protein